MADPEDHILRILRILREFREEFRTFRDQTASNFKDVTSRLDNIRRALNGGSVLGRYGAAEVEERLEAIEKRLSALESTD